MPATEAVSASQEERAGIPLDELAAIVALDAVRGFGPGAFRGLHDAHLTPAQLLADPAALPMDGKRAETLRRAIAAITDADRELATHRAAKQISRAAELGIRLITYSHGPYPKNLLASNNALPVLSARGDLSVIDEVDVVACVGSRAIRAPYDDYLARFAARAVSEGWVVASGFATGADTIAHTAAVRAGGRTLLVMPSGLDIPFPPENRELWHAWLERPGVCAISEFPLGTKASALQLRKRNKTTVGVARAVVVGQSSLKGGTMNAYRFAREQRKPVLAFSADRRNDTSGNRKIEAEEAEQLELAESYDGAHVYPLLKAWLNEASSST